MKICAIVPSYNHITAIGGVIECLKQAGLPVFVIDDGNQSPVKEKLQKLDDKANGVFVHRLEINGGKGAAVMKGFSLASDAGFTHALQVDADGQHDLTVIPQMIALATRYPEALITGKPVYNESMPKARKFGRWLTHIWVWVETLSFTITDSMCGFRIYPLGAVQLLLAQETLGRRMDFDPEIMVRLFWRGTSVVMVPVQVNYPPNNISNFETFKDNWRITCMHTRLVFTMLLRLPSILSHRPSKIDSGAHWASFKERGILGGLKFCALSYRLLGRRTCEYVISPIVLYFYLTGKKQRFASHEFLSRALKRPATFFDGYQHFKSFSLRMLDSFIGWLGCIPAGSIVEAPGSQLRIMANNPRGALIIVSHIGNVEVARAVMDNQSRERLIMLVHTKHAENYQRILREANPAAAMNCMQVTEMGPQTVIALQEQLQKGAWISMAGDRTPVVNRKHVLKVPFMGYPASFAQGPWILAALLECPVYLLFCLPQGDGYCLTMEHFAERIELPREQRQAALYDYIARYAQRLETYATSQPFQWFNFFPFWD